MNLNYLGCFDTDGSLLAADPAYEPESYGVKQIQVAPGRYHAYVVTGSLKNPLFDWDNLPLSFRNSELWIIHEDFKDEFNFKKIGSVGVDSGQAGFFNLSSFQQNKPKPKKLLNGPFNRTKRFIENYYLEIKELEDLIQNPESPQAKNRWNLLKDIWGTRDVYDKVLTTELSVKKKSLSNHLESLETKVYPSYLKTESSSDFYEICCDMTRGELQAEVDQDYGVNSMSGCGDGGYSVFAAKDEGVIKACYLSFINLKDLK